MNVEQGVTTILDEDGSTYEEALFDYDPDCLHELDPECWDGIKCTKCSGWFCY